MSGQFVPLGTRVEIVAGQHIEAALYNGDGIGTPYLTGPDDFGDHSPVIKKWTLTPRKLAKSGDVLVTVKGAGVGKCNLGCDAAIGRQLMALRPIPGLSVQNFVHHFIRHKFEEIAGLADGATVPGIGKNDLASLSFPVVSLDEQRRIAAILDQADALRRKRRDHASRIAALVSAKFQAMFGDPIGTKLLHPTVELASLIDPSRPITYGILKPGPDLPNGVPYVRVVDIKDGRVLTDQLRCTSPEIAHQYRRSTLRTGDVLMSIRGHVGRMALVPPEAAGANITQDTARLAIVGANPIFVRALMEHPLSKRWMAERTRGIAVQGINLGDLKKFPVLVPPKREQDNFAEFYKEVQLNRSAGDIQLAHLDALFASLQHRAFRGEL